MSLFQVVVTAVLATLATIIFGIVAAWSLWPTTAEAGITIAAHNSAWQSGELSHCERFGGEHVQFGEAVVTAALDLNDLQQTALQAVAAEVELWRSQAQATCNSTDMTSLEGGLAGLETMLAQSSTAVASLRPAVVEFYATLNTEQQEQLRTFIHSHRGHRRGLFNGHDH